MICQKGIPYSTALILILAKYKENFGQQTHCINSNQHRWGDVFVIYLASYQKHRPRLIAGLFFLKNRQKILARLLLNPHNTESYLLIHLKTAGVSMYQGFQEAKYSLYIIHIKVLLKIQWNIYTSVINPRWEDECNQDIAIFQWELYT